MPLYEYRCTKCGYRFEKIQSFNAEPESECPRCHGALERPLTAPALQFKGAGWYVNDYAPKAASSNSSESKPADAGAPTPAESKPAASDSTSKSSSPAPSSPSSSSSTDSGSKPASSSTTS